MGPLSGITVVELSTYIAAPGCGRALYTQGARVIKVESPKGDVERNFGTTLSEPVTAEENPNYDTLNGGKEHIVLDLKDPADYARFKKLLSKADVFLTNNRLPALKKMGLDYETLKEEFPRLVYAILLGYGEKGPRVNQPGFDTVAMFASAGMLQDLMVDVPGAYPVYIPMGFGDLVCGTILSGAIGTALYQREQTGKGDYVSVSLYGVGVWVFSIMSTAGQYGYPWPRNRYQGGPMAVPYKTKDGYWVLPVVNEYERYWPGFCKVLGADDIVNDPRFCTKIATLDPKNRADCVKYFEGKFAEKTLDEVLPALQAEDIIVDRLAHFVDNHSAEQALVNSYVSPITYSTGNTVTLAQPPVNFLSNEKPHAQRASLLGADTEAIFKEFDL